MPRFNAEMLRTIRLDLGLTQEQAATALGVDARTYRRYESGAVNDMAGGFTVRHPGRRALLRRMCEEFGVEGEDAWLSQSPASQDRPGWPERVVHPLPRARHFTGRVAPLAQLLAWHADATSAQGMPRVIVILGVGGAGKTSLLERFLGARGEPDAGAGGLLVWSFYEDPRTEAFLAEASAAFGGTGGDLDALLLALSGGPRHLLVLDGLEVLQASGAAGRALGEIEDPALRRLLRALAAGLGQARALVTSRLPLSDLSTWEGQGALTLPLGGLTSAEATALLRAWGVRGDDATLRPLAERVGGHALAVAMAGSYTGAFLAGDPAHLLAVPLSEAAEDDVLARRLHGVLDAYAAALTEKERALLCRLAVFPRGCDLALLRGLADAGGEVAGALAGCDEAGLLRLLRRLERRGLLSAGGPGGAPFLVHPFVRDHFRGLLGVSAEGLHQVARERVAAGLSGRPGAPPHDAELLDRHEALLEHTLLSGRALEAVLVYTRALGGFAHLGLRLGEMSRGARLVRAFFADGRPESPDRRLPASVAAGLAYDLGLYAGALGDLPLAERAYRAHLRLNEEETGPWALVGRTTGLRTLAYNTWLQGDLPGARLLLEEAIAVARRLEDRPHLLRAVALLGAVAHDQGELDEADRHFAAARALERGGPSARRGLWEAEHLLARGRHEQVADETRRNLAECEAKGWAGHVAHCHVLLGQIALVGRSGPAGAPELAEATAHLVAAREWTRRSGEVEMILRCHLLAARLARVAGRPSEAASEVAGGLEVARLGGFGLLAERLSREAVAPGGP